MVILPINPDDIPAVILPVFLTVYDSAVQPASPAKFHISQSNSFGGGILLNQCGINRAGGIGMAGI